jgi:4'-phosphopantetheinyl transferase
MTHALRARVMRWPSADAARIGEVDVKVYAASLLADEERLDRAVEILSSAERDRFSRYSNGVVARRFAIGRAIVREILGALRSQPPAAVQIVDGVHGKPLLSAKCNASPLSFSIAHCDDLLLVAVSRRGEVGVDVERIRSIESWERVAERTFAPAECAQLVRAVERGGVADGLFLRQWCRVEAQLKAIGCGINGIDAYRAGQQAAGLRVTDLKTLTLPPDLAELPARYLGAVALFAPGDRSGCQTARAASQQSMPTNAPTRASTP